MEGQRGRKPRHDLPMTGLRSGIGRAVRMDTCHRHDSGSAMRLWGPMRDMVTAKYVAEAAVAPHSPKGSQVERCGQYGPLGRHVCQTSQEEPPARSLLLDNPEHRLDQLLPQLVHLFSCRGGHPSAWRRSAASYGPTDTLRPFLSAHSKGRARPADGSGVPR